VVSVGPHALRITRPGAHRSTTSAGQASPATNTPIDPTPCGDNIATADGVQVSRLTPSRTSKACTSSGAAATASGTTTSRPPCNSGPQISHTDVSNPYELHCVHTPGGTYASATVKN